MTRVLQSADLRCPVSGKHAYPTETAALDQLALVWRRPTPGRGTERRAWRVYHCPECGWWHLSGRLREHLPEARDGD